MSETLFKNLSRDQIEKLIVDLGASRKIYKKGDYVCFAGNEITSIYYLEKGAIQAESVDYAGNVSIISTIEAGGVFGGAFAFVGGVCPLDVVALENSTAVVFPASIFFRLTSDEKSRETFMRNFVSVLAAKSVSLITKINHVTAKSIRGKVLAYLTTQSTIAHSDEFTIPFSRQQLADYLSVDRSALSKELSLMKQDGLIDYKKSKFVLLKK